MTMLVSSTASVPGGARFQRKQSTGCSSNESTDHRVNKRPRLERITAQYSDITDVLDRKTAGISVYASQLPQWEMYAFDQTEKAHIGKRSGQTTGATPSARQPHVTSCAFAA